MLKSAIPVALPLSDKIPVIEKVCVLPDPDPSYAKTFPFFIEKDILSTALIKPCDVSKLTPNHLHLILFAFNNLDQEHLLDHHR